MKLRSKFVLIVFLGFYIGFNLLYSDSIDSYAQPLTSSFPTTDPIIDSIKFDSSTGNVAVNQKTNTVYVTNYFEGTVSIIDGSTNEIVDVLDVEKTPFGIGINQETNMIYVASEFNNILYIINGLSNEIEDTIQIIAPYDIAVNHKTNMIYVTSDRTGLVYVIDGNKNKIEHTFEDPSMIETVPSK